MIGYFSEATSIQSFPRLLFNKAAFLLCPTGSYCREDRCQSFFNFELIPTVRAPLEECEIAGVFKKVGLEHFIIDAPAEKLNSDQFLRRILDQQPDLVIVAVTFGSLQADLSWVKQLRLSLPQAKIGLRGAPCYVWSQQLLEAHIELDFCVHGEYELIFEQLVTRDFENCDGITYRQKSGVILSRPAVLAKDLDSLPLPDRSALNQNLYKVRGFGKNQATVRVQRGCPFPCTYCLVHTVSGNKPRQRSALSIAEEILELQRQGINYFYLRADTFSFDKEWAIAVSNQLSKTCPGARWVTTTRVECFDQTVAQAMSAGGCYGISFGIDVASETIGQKVKKPPRLVEAQNALRLCDQYKILSLGYFMIGFIWDTPETLAETSRFIWQVRPDLLTIHFAHPYPGTKYHTAVKELGGEVISAHAQAEPALALAQLSPKDLRRAARNMLLKHYLRPSVACSIARKVLL